MKKTLLAGAKNYYLATAALHLVAFALLIFAALHSPKFLSLGLLAYTLGARHAFDADHIAAIDNTVRKLMQQQKPSYGVGFFFSLGHSSVVFLMALGICFSVKWVRLELPTCAKIGGHIGSIVSGSFLLIVALYNLLVLKQLITAMKDVKSNQPVALEEIIETGFLTKLLKPFFNCISHEWQMYPIGFLFGLGFDTATEIALLALSASAAQSTMPAWGVLALPLLFAAGMNLMDTTDSVMMTGAYGWAFDKPMRKLYYNLVVTVVSIIAAICIGLVELLQVCHDDLAGSGWFWHWITNIDFNNVGYFLVVMFIVLWGFGYLSWRYLIRKQPEQLP